MIGIFDSGVGGMTVARAVERTLPGYPLIYFGDLARTPYGSKSPETIIDYSIQNTEFLLEQGAELIIVACNSAASVASEELRQRFDVPFFEVITPAVRSAVDTTDNGRIGVIGTSATIKSGIYERKISEIAADHTIFSQACPLFVPLVEEGWLNRQETKMIIRRYLHPLKNRQIDTLVLGCTHYPLLAELIQPRIGKQVRIIDSSCAVAANLKKYLEQNGGIAGKLAGNMENRYYVSDITEGAKAIARRIFGREIDLIKNRLSH